VQSVADEEDGAAAAASGASGDIAIDITVDAVTDDAPLKELRKRYFDANQYDKTWCVCGALVYLKQADANEKQFYEQYKPRGLTKAKRAMSAESWGKLVHADENRQLSAIYAASWRGVATMKAFPHKDYGIKRKDRRKLEGDALLFSKLFWYVGQTLGVELPEMFLVEDSKGGMIQLANAIEKKELCPSFLVRPNLLQGKTEREVGFLCAQRLTFMRPEYYLKMLLPTNSELKLVALSAMVMVNPYVSISGDVAAIVERYQAVMQGHVSAATVDAAVRSFVGAGRGAQPEVDAATWSNAVEATSHRAGLVLCGDLEASARMIEAEPAVAGGRTTKEKVAEMVRFSTSEAYFAIREQMGLQIS